MPPKSSLGKPKYSEGEKILCFHGPLLYEAKCLGVDVKEGQIKYFVHYQGWNKNWDEWVGDARIMKFNAVGLQKQKELKELYSKPGKKVKGLRKSDLLNQEYPPPEALRHLEAAEGTSADDGGGPHHPLPPPPPPPLPPPLLSSSSSQQAGGAAVSNKRARGESASISVSELAVYSTSGGSAESAAGVSGGAGGGISELTGPLMPTTSGGVSTAAAGGSKRLRIQIEMPRLLKMWLVDDAELVCRQRRLHILPPPAGQTVSGILGRFVTIQAGGADDFERERLSEFVAGVQSYFNAVLTTQLLYPNEKQQYSALLKSHRGAMPASFYGCLHLVRLFVRLGDLVSQTKLDLRCLNSLLDYCDAFLLFVEKNIETFASSTNYEQTGDSRN